MATRMLSRFVVKLARPKVFRVDSYEHFGLERVEKQIREYEHLGDNAILDASILDCDRALSLVLPNLLADPDQAAKWTVPMASCLRLRFERDGVPKDIKDARQMLENVLASVTPGSTIHTKALYALGHLFAALHHHTGVREHISQAHNCFGRALDGMEMMTVEDATAIEMDLLIALAWCLNTIPARKANSEAIRLCSSVLHEAKDTDAVFVLAAHGLSCASYSRWDMNSRQDKTDLINAQDYARRAAETPHRLRARHLTWLATLCRERADSGDDASYFEEAIERSAEAVELMKERHAPASHEVSTSLIALGLAYYSRYKVHNAPEDLDNAINLHRRALTTIAFTHFSVRHTLVDCLCDRYQALGLPKDIEDAFEIAKQAFGDAPHRTNDKLLSLANIGRTLALRYSHGKENTDFTASQAALSDAAQMFRESEGYPPGLMVFILELLAKIHDIHFQVRRRPEDAELSLRYVEEAIAIRKEFALPLEEPSPRNSSITQHNSVSETAENEPHSKGADVSISQERHSDESADFQLMTCFLTFLAEDTSSKFLPLFRFLGRTLCSDYVAHYATYVIPLGGYTWDGTTGQSTEECSCLDPTSLLLALRNVLEAASIALLLSSDRWTQDLVTSTRPFVTMSSTTFGLKVSSSTERLSILAKLEQSGI
ncbi:hypothetical protein DACRYDRAFT_100256 [Dacryopinax primogenitus]|uniref:TPR-like protein n=1 Tax=Dacryopinax primogenitus (strain DJM 731) TaxID=1858805 RepID=M5GB84_DACPD|nr:uncharacterized protein DACRYDRAFT_100256 [Dacryopinax primogenitus]EJU01228.1 hypothetical protein DACRYDRAFT_100256 [Dacryopinax primogenitus]